MQTPNATVRKLSQQIVIIDTVESPATVTDNLHRAIASFHAAEGFSRMH